MRNIEAEGQPGWLSPSLSQSIFLESYWDSNFRLLMGHFLIFAPWMSLPWKSSNPLDQFNRLLSIHIAFLVIKILLTTRMAQLLVNDPPTHTPSELPACPVTFLRSHSRMLTSFALLPLPSPILTLTFSQLHFLFHGENKSHRARNTSTSGYYYWTWKIVWMFTFLSTSEEVALLLLKAKLSACTQGHSLPKSSENLLHQYPPFLSSVFNFSLAT